MKEENIRKLHVSHTSSSTQLNTISYSSNSYSRDAKVSLTQSNSNLAFIKLESREENSTFRWWIGFFETRQVNKIR